MRGAIPPLPQYVFMVCCFVKYKDNFTFTFICYSRDSSVNIVTGLRAGLLGSIPGRRSNDIYLRHGVQSGSRVHAVSYPVGTGGCFSEDEAAGA
jgi:hypothetical protein